MVVAQQYVDLAALKQRHPLADVVLAAGVQLRCARAAVPSTTRPASTASAVAPAAPLISWAEFLVQVPVQPKRRRQQQPASLPLFEWLLAQEQAERVSQSA